MGDPVTAATEQARLLSWAQNLSADAQLVVRLLPFGGHVRLRPSAAAELAKDTPVNPLSWGVPPPEGDEDIEGFTLEVSHLVSFLRAQGAGRAESRNRVGAALTELTLHDLVKTFQDEAEEPRYALTESGLKVQNVLAAAEG